MTDSTSPVSGAGSPVSRTGAAGAPQVAASGERVAGAGELRRNVLTPRHVLIVAIAATGPMSVVALNFGPMASFAGPAMVLAFVVSLVGIVLLGLCFSQFARHYPSAGGLYAWAVRSFGNNGGFVYGWLFAGSYLVFAAAGFAVFGGWGEQYIETIFGVKIAWWIFSLAAIAYTSVLAYFGIRTSVGSAFVLLAFELIVAFVFAAYVWGDHPAGVSAFTSKPFLPSSSPGGWAAIGLAMTFGVLSSVGFEEASTMSEEARDARRTIGRGMVWAGFITQAFYILTAYALLIGYGDFAKFSKDPAPLLTLGEGRGKVWLTFVVLAALSSILAFSQTAFNAGIRVIYALGREGVVPHVFGRTHHRHHTPHVSIALMTVVAVALAFPLAFSVGAFNVWFYFGFLISIAFLVLYGLTAIGLIFTAFRDKRAFPTVNPLTHVVIPLAAAALMAYPLYRTVSPLPPGVYRTLPLYLIGWLVIGVGVLFYLRRSRPDAIARVGSLMAGGELEPTGGEATSFRA
ncbi:MAG TPA: APC family permease [Candidatus Eisenbacteria bacterium]|jgi:amino acid transporter